MNIVGISYSGNHESAACLVQDGRLVFACAEERLSRVKLDGSFPVRAIQAALEFAGLGLKDVDQVAINWPHSMRARVHDLRLMLTGQWPVNMARLERLAIGMLSSMRHRGGALDVERAFDGIKAPLHFVDHHRAHALSAYCLSGFDESGVLIVDGRGANEATTLWHARDGTMQLLDTYEYPDSLGVFYAGITEVLGFQPLSDEWKVMGLASYGKPTRDLSDLVMVSEDTYRVDARKFFGRRDGDLSELELIVGRRRRETEPLTEQHQDVARSAQDRCEEAMTALLRRLKRRTNSPRLCLAGGVALNSKANGELLRSGLIDDIYVQPAAGDDGGCIGAAFAVYENLGLPLPRKPISHTYLGTEFSNEQIEKVLRVYKLPYRRLEHAPRAAAELLAQNHLVGWFQGRMEFGPRALGARSILSDPRFEANRDRVNEAVKFRESWRPFAPSVLHEKGARYFDDYYASPYMILTFWANALAKKEIPAVVHVDGSSRVQSVFRETNERYHSLITEFEKLTSVPVVMNTSFNLKGDPIVCTPKDAIETFYTSGLDDLVIGDFLVSKTS
jgi:carbamoyltransferase